VFAHFLLGKTAHKGHEESRMAGLTGFLRIVPIDKIPRNPVNPAIPSLIFAYRSVKLRLSGVLRYEL
jgi:hypothetical protein